jgi:hypothetical protein
MAIKFVCSCGKHLRAREEMAARRSVCPACGAPVGIPSLQPTHPGTGAAPMSPKDRWRTRRVVPRPDGPPPDDAITAAGGALTARPAPPPIDWTEPELSADPTPLEVESVRLRQPPKPAPPRRGRWELETNGYQCLAYPFHVWRSVLGLAVLLTGLAGGVALLAPSLLQQPPDAFTFWFVTLSLGLFLFTAVSYACAFLQSVLAAALAGQVHHPRWPGRDLKLAVRCGVLVLASFLAGPVVFAAAGLLYWLYGGRPQLVDWLILAELGAAAVAFWLLALVAVSRHGRLRDANPLRVADVTARLGWRPLGVVLLAAAVAVGHGLMTAFALQELHQDRLQGWLWLSECGLVGMFCATFLLRWLGVSCHRSGV